MQIYSKTTKSWLNRIILWEGIQMGNHGQEKAGLAALRIFLKNKKDS